MLMKSANNKKTHISSFIAQPNHQNGAKNGEIDYSLQYTKTFSSFLQPIWQRLVLSRFVILRRYVIHVPTSYGN